MKPLTFAVLGAGNRGNAYGNYLLRHPDSGRVTAVAEPDPGRRERYTARHGIAADQVFGGWEELLAARPPVDAIIVTTQDQMHRAPAIQALELGYDVLLEKPISPSPAECVAVADAAERTGRILTVCHVLRYTPFFQTIKQLVDSARIGRLVSVQWTENVGWWHMAHSYVRGNWRRLDQGSPMILAKSSHDLDAIQWLVGEPCQKVSSFGSLVHFKPENAPAGSADRCTGGCAVEHTCPYSALRIYMNVPDGQWPVTVVTADFTPEGRLKALQEGPYGRCVYRSDNDVVDHQVVNLEFGGGVTASFTMSGFTAEMARTLKLMGTHGEIRGHMEKNEIEVTDFLGKRELIYPERLPGHHGGGDDGLMRHFLRQLRERDAAANLTSARVSAATHLLAFAAEESRLTGATVDFPRFAGEVGGS